MFVKSNLLIIKIIKIEKKKARNEDSYLFQ